MKKYTYTGTSILSFSFEDKDFVVFGAGPHDLPESSPIVQSNIAVGNLVLLADETKSGTIKITK